MFEYMNVDDWYTVLTEFPVAAALMADLNLAREVEHLERVCAQPYANKWEHYRLRKLKLILKFEEENQNEIQKC